MTNFLNELQDMVWRRRARCRRDSKLRMTARLVALMIVIVGVLDVISTNASIAAGGTETNALVAGLMTQLGEWWLVPKLAIHVLVALFILWLPSKRLIWQARICVIAYTLIIANNFYIADWTFV